MVRLVMVCCVLLSSMAVAGPPVRLTKDGHPKRDPVFLNASGSELLYVQLDKPNQLRLMKLSMTDQTSVPLHPQETRSEFEPAVSADGRYLAFVQNRGNLTLALVIQDLIENQTSEVPPGGGFSGMRCPAFTPDASRVFFSYPEEGRQQIYSVDPKGKNKKMVIDSEGVNNWPQFAPQGDRFVFASSRDDDYELYLADANGGSLRRLTESPGQDIRPRFSPDGTRIVFTSNRDGNYELYMMKADGSEVTRLTNHPEQDDYAIWHPNGKQLVYSSERNGAFDLYTMEVPAVDR